MRMGRTLLGLGLGGLLVAGLLWSSSHFDASIHPGADAVYVRARALDARQRARQREGRRLWQARGSAVLADLRRSDDAALREALTRVDQYFARAGRGTASFSKGVLGWDGQWAALASRVATALEKLDRLPSWLRWRWLNEKAQLLAVALDKKAFHKHVRGQLRQHVISRAGLETVVRDAVQQYQQRLARRDARLLDRLGDPELDGLADATPSTSRASAKPRQLEAVYLASTRDAFGHAREGAESELARSLVQRVGSKLLIALAAYAVKEGAVELGLLTAGTASALWSMGVGLAVAVLANWALRYFLNRMGKSPRKAIERRLAAELRTMRRCMIEGCTRRAGPDTITITGLRTRLTRYATRQAQRREQALRQTFGFGASDRR